MILSPQESETFFKLWSCVDAYVNTRTNAVPGFTTPEQLRCMQPNQLQQIRKSLWEQRALLDEFVSENPFSLSGDELADVQRFRHAVRGDFYVERFLKDHAIFVSMGHGAPRVYAVGGLRESVDEMLHRSGGHGAATMVNATLIPFRRRIVWDGIVSVYRMTFGPGTRREFKNAYVRAKDRDELISSLDPAQTSPKPRAVGPDWRPSVDAIVAAANKLGKPRTSLQEATFKLLNLSARLAQEALREPLEGEDLEALLKKAARAIKQVSEAVERER